VCVVKIRMDRTNDEQVNKQRYFVSKI
jgi:hypothetical protein